MARFIVENMRVFDFEIDGEDMGVLDGLNSGVRKDWNPYSIEW